MKIPHLVELADKCRNNISDLAQSALFEIRARRAPTQKPTYIEGKSFAELWQQEWTLFVKGRWQERQVDEGVDIGSVTGPTTRLRLVGLALSGGGIRSATFNLGLLQAMGRLKLLKYCDYLSTVSGGGYIGSCLTSHLHHQAGSQLEGQRFPFGFPRPGRESTGEERAEVRHLRNHSNYLVPRHGLFSLDTWRLVGTYLSGLLVLLPVPLAALVILAGFLDVASSSLKWLPWPSGESFWPTPPVWRWPLRQCLGGDRGTDWLCLVSFGWSPPGLVRVFLTIGLGMFGCFLISVFMFLLLMSEQSRPEQREFLAAFQSRTLQLLVFSILVALLPTLVWGWHAIWQRAGPRQGEIGKWVLSILSLLLTLAANREWQKKWLAGLKIPLIKGSVVVFLISLGLTVLDLYRQHSKTAVLASILIFMAGLFFLDPDRASLHFLYRDRLAGVYVVKPSAGVPDQFVPDHDLRLSNLCRGSSGQVESSPPYHLINAAINLAGDPDPDLRGRKAHLFQLSPFYCGSEKTGWRESEDYESDRMDLATAMAISGAAVSSQMGMYTNRPLAMLMTLLNIRLGSWTQNPEKDKVRRGGMLWTLFRELLGLTSRDLPYVNLSDGGHFENLGLYGLIQRRCKYIIVSDAGADAAFAFADLGNVLRKIRIDFGVQVEDMNLSMVRPDPQSGLSRSHCAVGRILYPAGEEGLLIYLKPTLSGNEPADLLHYRGQHKTFPHETTADQFFDEAQFESYRALGYQIGKEVFAPARDVLEQPGADVAEMIFERLCKHWQGPGTNPAIPA